MHFKKALPGLLKCHVLDTTHWKPKSDTLFIITMPMNKMCVQWEYKSSEDKKIMNCHSLCNISSLFGAFNEFLNRILTAI